MKSAYRTWGRRVATVALAGGLGVTVAAVVRAQSTASNSVLSDSTCTSAAAPTTFTGTVLDQQTPTRNGVVFDGADATLRLQKTGGNFQVSRLPVTDTVMLACSGDFDSDGWTDFIGGGPSGSGYLRFYKNRTYENPAPVDWTNPALVRAPKFVRTTDITASGTSGGGYMECGDLNGDGKQDFIVVRTSSGDGTTPAQADAYLGKGNGTFNAPYQFVTSLSTLSNEGWSSNAADFVDYNGDGKLDIIVGLQAGTGGRVVALLNDGAANPKFNSSVTLVNNAGMGSIGATAVAMAEVTGDNVNDLLVGSPSSGDLRLYPGLLGGGVSTTYQVIASAGAVNAILLEDFSLDGKLDLIYGTDNWNYGGGHIGGQTYYYQSGGGTKPYQAGLTRQLSTHQDPHNAGSLYDFDLGFKIDYDGDPDRTTDFVMADGNDSGTYFVFANRVVTNYVTCGSVTSSTLDIGSLATQDMTISAVQLTPTVTLNGGTATWEASNDGGKSWRPGTACSGDASKVCATFDKNVGRQIQWRATLCSNATHTASPKISNVAVSYSYVVAKSYVRAGSTASEGLIYLGAFRQPGDTGRFFAINDQTGATVWDASVALESTADSARKIYTASSANARLEFSASNVSSAAFRSTILAADTTAATTTVNWVRSQRFGLTSPQRFGSVENSTAAIVTVPKAPYWYPYTATTANERAAIDAYVNAYANRPRLALVGSKDGQVHAFRTDPNNLADTNNGKEAWSFIPYDVAQRMEADRTSGLIAAFPDGSPTLTSAKINGQWRTVMVSGESNGGRSVYALDVTDSITAAGVVNGPTPLWTFSDANMGYTYSKPTVARIRSGGVEKWLAIFASGPGLSTDIGDSLYAVDLTTGQLFWQFNIGDANTYISTDITAVETDDAGESGAPQYDGYIDRIIFGDSKGRVWKIDPATNIDKVIVPATPGVTITGLTSRPLFSTKVSTGGLGVDRAILGSIAAAPDQTGRLTLYFGTGTPDSATVNEQNAFYAVYADTGQVRSAYNAGAGLAQGMKFTGGVVINDGQIILGIGRDLASTGLCAPSEGQILALDANTFTRQFVVPTTSKVVSPVYVRNGQYYTTNYTGQLQTSAYTGTTTSTSSTSSTASGTPGTTPNPFQVVNWYQRN